MTDTSPRWRLGNGRAITSNASVALEVRAAIRDAASQQESWLLSWDSGGSGQGALSPCVAILSLCHVLVYLRQTKQVVVAAAAVAEWTRLDKLPHRQRGSGRGRGGNIGGQIMPALSPIRMEVLSPG